MAKKLRVSPQMVGRWRARFVTRRVDGLLDEPRPGAPRTITDDTVEAVIVRTLETTPDGATHWSTRTMAKATGLSHGTIARSWRAFGLQRTKTFTLSPDPLLVEKVRDVVGLYLHPPDHALVLCADEKSQIQALDRTQPLLPMQPGQTARHTHTYRRHGTTSLFAALDAQSGQVIGRTSRRHRAIAFRTFLDLIEAADPRAQELALADNRVAELDLDWDPAVLRQLEQAGVALEAFWTPEEFARLLAPEGPEAQLDENTVLAPPTTTTIRRGDVFQLGRHRLACGDATSAPPPPSATAAAAR